MIVLSLLINFNNCTQKIIQTIIKYNIKILILEKMALKLMKLSKKLFIAKNLILIQKKTK